MANRKISQFTTVTDITTVSGLAGYDATTNVQISGTALISSLQTNLYTPFGAVGDVLTIDSNGVPAWEPGGAGSLQDLDSVLTQGNQSSNGGEIEMLDAGGFNPLTFSQTGLAASPSSNISFTGSGFISMVTSGAAGGVSLSTAFSSGAANIIITAGSTGGRLELRSEGLLRFNFETPTANQVLQTINSSGDMEWVDLPSGSASGLGDVLTAGNESDDGQILKMVDAGEYLEVYANSIKHTTIANDFEIENEEGDLSLIASENIEIESGGELRVKPNAVLGTPNTGYVLTAKNALGDLEWSQFAIAQPLPNVLTNGSTANPGQSITFSGGGGTINVFSITGSDTNGSNEVKASGGNVEINSVSDDVVLKGGGDLYLENTGLGTPTSGDYLIADGVAGKTAWFTDPKAFVTLGNNTWVIRDGYNAIWNIGAGSLTLAIAASDGDSGTLIVINNGGEITWPTNSNWPDATEPTLTTTGTDVFSFIYDGTNYYWSFGQNFGA